MEKSCRILLVHNRYQIPGGEDTVFENEAKLLEEHGHTVFRYERNNTEIKERSGVGKLALPFETIYSLKSEADIRHLIREKQIDLVHVHNTLLLVSSSVFDAALKEHVPVIQTIHNFRMICPAGICYRDGRICLDCLSKGLSSAVKNRCYRGSLSQSLVLTVSMQFQRLRRIYRHVHFIVLTEFNRGMLMKQGQIALRQIDVKPNFTDCEREILPFEKRKRQIVFAGRLDETKGVRFLLEIAERMKDSDWTFVILGTGPLAEECQKTVSEKNLTHVELRGLVDHDTVLDEIAQSQALILPTRWYEGFPMTLVEAMSLGTPCIVPDFGNAGSMIAEGKSGYHYHADDPDSCMQVFTKNLSINEQVRAEYEANYSKEANYRILMEIYGKVLREHERK